MQRRLSLAFLFALVTLASCHHDPTSLNPGSILNFDCVGHGYSWTDVVGQNFEYPVTARWTRSIDSSNASLLATDSIGRTDTIYLRHDTTGWRFAPNDSRSSFGFNPVVVESTDSVYFGMGFGFSGTGYFLKKQR